MIEVKHIHYAQFSTYNPQIRFLEKKGGIVGEGRFGSWVHMLPNEQ